MKKKTKFSLGMKIVTFLTVITMASVGFAAWVITAPVTEAAADGQISVDTATNNGAPIAISALICDDGNGTNTFEEDAPNYEKYSKIVFGKTEFGDEEGEDGFEQDNYGWLDNTTEGFTSENLTVFVKVTITNNQAAAYGSDITFTFEPVASDSDINEFNSAMESLLTKPTITATYASEGSTDGLTATYDTTTKKAVATIPAAKIPETKDGKYTVVFAITFDWGSSFGNMNPYIYYNMQEHTDPLATTATTNLNNLYTAVTGVSYKVTVGVVA